MQRFLDAQWSEIFFRQASPSKSGGVDFLYPAGKELFQKARIERPRFSYIGYFGSVQRTSQGTTFALRKAGFAHDDPEFHSYVVDHKLLDEYDTPNVSSLKAEIQGLRKYDRDNTVDLPITVFHMYTRLREHAPWITKSTRLSYSETIGRLNLSTSCGFPLNRLFRNKREFLRYVNLDEEMKLYEEFVLTGDQPITIWSSFLKDEIVPARKIYEPRQINCPGLHYLILFSSFVLDYNDQYIQGWSRKDSEHAVGIDVRSFDWHILMQRVLTHPYNLSIDHKSFDATINAKWFDAIFMLRSELLSLSHREHALFSACYKALRSSHVILCNGDIFTVNGGNMSGSPCTTEDNCMVNSCSNGMVLSQMDVEYTQVVYGDDALITTSSKVNFDEFCVLKQNLGLIIKPEFDNSLIENRNVCFLSRANKCVNGLDFSISSNPDKLLVSAFVTNTRNHKLQFAKLCAIREVLFGCEPHFTLIDNVIRRVIATFSFPRGFVASHYRSRSHLIALRGVFH